MSAPAVLDDGGKNLVFIVGAPRSGTTWLQRSMGAHPDVVTTQETALLDRYVAPLLDSWVEQLPQDLEAWRRRRHRGLPAVLTTDELEEHVVGLARLVYGKALGLKPGARVAMDKNPDHALHTHLIRRLFPDAAVLHIVRDGRDVAASMVTASKTWGREWAPSQVGFAAQAWRTYVEGAASAEGSGRYLQVRYEDLVADPVSGLRTCFAFADVPASEQECAALANRFSRSSTEESMVWSGEVVRRLGATPIEPEGFFGAGRDAGWRSTWDARDRLAFDTVAGGLLRHLGYVDDEDWVGVTALRRTSAAQAARAREAARRLGWRLHMALGRRGLYVHVARTPPYR